MRALVAPLDSRYSQVGFNLVSVQLWADCFLPKFKVNLAIWFDLANMFQLGRNTLDWNTNGTLPFSTNSDFSLGITIFRDFTHFLAFKILTFSPIFKKCVISALSPTRRTWWRQRCRSSRKFTPISRWRRSTSCSSQAPEDSWSALHPECSVAP